MATKYELPEEVNEKRLRTLGMEVEMKTLKTNVAQEGETCELDDLEQQSEIRGRPRSYAFCEVDSDTDGRETKAMFSEDYLQTAGKSVSNANPLKIICVGDYTGGVRTKGVFVKDYLGIKPSHSFTCIDFYLKRVEWQRRGHLESCYSIFLQLCEISDMERFSAMTKVYFKYSKGALVFWGPHNPASLDGAVQWRKKIKKEVSLPIPCVLVTDNVADSCVKSVNWIGPGKIFESEVALDEFCKDHGFVDHFEIKSRDLESGEKSVFGQAVNCLLNEILQSEQKEAKT
ncbi:multi-organism toxin transport [Desmophyllum pertusum]|uniref:Multi-organism toxin transport n=1 Tax=Desmophyllum pertusum TaxID=174260 RepID=A0A9W9YUM7_9CNID|nr:multi-organism toxin transport [Desmophyllum pertusum]